MKFKHILTKHEFEAKDIFKSLIKLSQEELLEEFDVFALKKSICSSASIGGDLGEILKKANVDPDFKAACLNLSVKELSSITRTSFGYHIIFRYE